MNEGIGERHASACRYKSAVPEGSRPMALDLETTIIIWERLLFGRAKLLLSREKHWASNGQTARQEPRPPEISPSRNRVPLGSRRSARRTHCWLREVKKKAVTSRLTPKRPCLLNWTAPLCPLSPDLFADFAWRSTAVWSQTNWGRGLVTVEQGHPK